MSVIISMSILTSPAHGAESDPATNPNANVVQVEAAPEGYWTPERKRAAVENSLSEIKTNSTPVPKNRLQTFSDDSGEEEPETPWEKWQSVAFRQGPGFPNMPTITHNGIQYEPTVGKILMTRYLKGKDPKPDSCTGTVLASNTGSIIITAGHCIWPNERTATSSHIRFIPAYHVIDNGTEGGLQQSPRGEWDITAIHGDTCWLAQKLETCDQAFLRVDPLSDGTTLQDHVGGRGLNIGGSPVRGKKTPEMQWAPPLLTMHSYPVNDRRHLDIIIDESRVYKCEGETKEANQKNHWGIITMPCSEDITGGASGAGLIERTSSGESLIATFIGKIGETSLSFKLNDSRTKKLYQEIDY